MTAEERGSHEVGSSTIALADGRRLGIAEFGDPAGRPVLFFHGFPGARLDYRLMDSGEAAKEAGARIIAVDRPGCGLSDALRGRELLSWPADVSALADALEIDRFAVLGLSGGGPYAASCAYALSDRVAVAGIVSGMGPAEAPGMKEGVSWTIPGKPALFRRVILWLMRIGLERDPARILAQTKASLPAPDRALLEEGDLAELFLDGLREALRPPSAGALDDARIYLSPWGFRLEDIQVPIRLWHGSEDLNVPISAARWVAESIPSCTAELLVGEGHLTVARRQNQEILESVLEW